MDSYYQIATQPKLYVSYPLWQYASGALDAINVDGADITDEQLIKLLQLDPAKFMQVDIEGNVNIAMDFKIVPNSDNFTTVIEQGLWNYDFFAILGHNLHTSGLIPSIEALNDQNSINLAMSQLVNYVPNSIPDYDGWSLMSITDKPDQDYRTFRLSLNSTNGVTANKLKLGSIMWGKAFEFPVNANLSETFSIDYGVTQKETITGKTISNLNWSKLNNWVTEPWGLTNSEEGDNFQRRSGRRKWKLQFDSLAPEKVMNQLMMMNSNGWNAKDNHAVYGVDNKSQYNINNAIDFYSNCVHKSLGGHLPMMLQVDKDDFSPQGFALVRMKSNYQIVQKTPNLYNISIELVEQI